MNHRDRLRSLLTERSLAMGDFTLASGARSTYYIDARLTTMSAEGQFLIGLTGWESLREHFPGAGWVGGLTLGADPISYAIAHRSWLEGDAIEAFTVRKSPKEHGTGRRIEGGVLPGARVVVIEDTLTRGGSALEAVGVLADHGAEVLGVLTLVDREAGGSDRVREAGYPVHSLFTASELLRSAGGEIPAT
ncbi:MAG: orotate phosphoribosyltransferase [Gemmatimonadota bacterium]